MSEIINQQPQIKKTFSREWWIEKLTPKRTEEVKPNLFIQQINPKDKPDKYRQITPVAWNGKIINKTALILGANPIKSTLIFLFILFMAWSYTHDLNTTHNFYNQMFFNNSYSLNICMAQAQGKLSANESYGLNITEFCIIKYHSNNSLVKESDINLGEINWSFK